MAHWLPKIQVHDLTITTSKTIKGHDLVLHLAQDLEDSKEFNNQQETISYLLCIHEEEVELNNHPWYHDIIQF